MQLDKVNSAIRSILDACYASNDPLLALQAQMYELRHSGKWSERQIGDVRTAVLGILKGMAAGQQ
jgi:hypothetical protein